MINRERAVKFLVVAVVSNTAVAVITATLASYWDMRNDGMEFATLNDPSEIALCQSANGLILFEYQRSIFGETWTINSRRPSSSKHNHLELPYWASPPSVGDWMVSGFGWPLRWLKFEKTGDVFNTHPATYQLVGAAECTIYGRKIRLIYGVALFNAIMNVVMISILSASVVEGYSRAHGAYRRSRHLCENCGYSLRAISVDTCPECGHRTC